MPLNFSTHSQLHFLKPVPSQMVKIMGDGRSTKFCKLLKLKKIVLPLSHHKLFTFLLELLLGYV